MNDSWIEKSNTLQKTFHFSDFKTAFLFASQVAEYAEEMNHHPEITVGWGKCEITLTSHDVQGVTERDFILSKKIDSIPTKPT